MDNNRGSVVSRRKLLSVSAMGFVGLLSGCAESAQKAVDDVAGASEIGVSVPETPSPDETPDASFSFSGKGGEQFSLVHAGGENVHADDIAIYYENPNGSIERETWDAGEQLNEDDKYKYLVEEGEEFLSKGVLHENTDVRVNWTRNNVEMARFVVGEGSPDMSQVDTSVPPDVEFSYGYDPDSGQITIRHRGGDMFEAHNVQVRYETPDGQLVHAPWGFKRRVAHEGDVFESTRPVNESKGVQIVWVKRNPWTGKVEEEIVIGGYQVVG